MFPALSVALTANVCGPAVSAACAFGETQGANAGPSSRQSKVLPLSLAVNEKLGEVLLLGSLGLPMIVAVGATVSIVQVNVSSALGLPAGSWP